MLPVHLCILSTDWEPPDRSPSSAVSGSVCSFPCLRGRSRQLCKWKQSLPTTHAPHISRALWNEKRYPERSPLIPPAEAALSHCCPCAIFRRLWIELFEHVQIQPWRGPRTCSWRSGNKSCYSDKRWQATGIWQASNLLHFLHIWICRPP